MKYRKSRHQIKMKRIKYLVEVWNKELNEQKNILIKDIKLIGNRIEINANYDHFFDKLSKVETIKRFESNQVFRTIIIPNHYNEKNFIYDISRYITNIYNVADSLLRNAFLILKNIDIWDKLSKEIEDVIKTERISVFTSLDILKTLKEPAKFKVLINEKTRCIYIYDVKTKTKVYSLRVPKDYRDCEIIESLYFRHKGLYYEACPYSEYEYSCKDKVNIDNIFISIPKYIGLSCVIYEKELETNGLFQIKNVYPQNDLVAKLKRK